MGEITPTHVEANLGRPLTQAEVGQVDLWIGWAQQRIARRAAKLGRSVESLDQAVLEEVVVEAVTRRARQPEPITQVDVQVDDGSVSKRYQQSSGLVEILPEWWDDLGLTERPRGAFTIRPAYQPDNRW